jgi:hypothetical protein
MLATAFPHPRAEYPMETKDTPIFEQSVFEADIDWLLCLQINTNRRFRSWLDQKVFGHAGKHIGAWRSIAENSGESDLVWIVESNNLHRRMALIENKINAAAQERQYERYHERAEIYEHQGKCSEFVIVLCAPEKYSSTDSDLYSVRITYEEIRDWFNENDLDGSGYFADLMQRAISKSIEIKPPDAEITLFQRQVWELANREFPEIGLGEPRPGREYWVTQSYGDFSIRYKMLKKHGEFVRCVVDLELPNRGGDVEILLRDLGQVLGQIGAEITRTGKSAAVRVNVPVVAPPSFDEQKVRAALHSWSNLLRWWRKVERAYREPIKV